MTDTIGLLGPWMANQRWYGNKGQASELELVGSCPLPSGEPGVGIIVHFVLDRSPGKSAVYQVPVTYRDRREESLDFALIGALEDSTAFAYDAPHDQVYSSALLRVMIEGEKVTGDATAVLGEPTTPAEITGLRSRVLTGEQSNTSIIFEADQSDLPPIICKIFRTLQSGNNPDVELQSALAVAGSTLVPLSIASLHGWWPDSREQSGTASGHLAFAQEFIPGVEDAWRVALASAEAGEDFSSAARALGTATAQIHATLALALPSAPTTPADMAAALHQFRQRMETGIRDAPGLEGHRAELERLFDLAREVPWPPQQRIHGDYHLGQVLLAPGRGWVIVDFEGEPLRPMGERTRPDSPLRDVAGMLRSFDYVAGCLLLEKSIDAAEWARAARAAFLEGYVEGSGYDVAGNRLLLDTFELDKALYETTYEARNRPSWLNIPASAVARLAGGGAKRG